MLQCSKCQSHFPDEDFPKNSRATNRRARGYWCRTCSSAHYFANQDRQQASNQRARVKRRYGLEWTKYQELLGLGCVICGSFDRLHVDHCHATGKTRGVLCQGCNHALGGARDQPTLLRALADWLESDPCVAQGLPGDSDETRGGVT